ncbi:MAG TPA: MBL fold metallo-hydrolase [Burkholderiaceae bacterium]|nr:MBL fold metallo-hydrolase [Burkholderiaceae bacterium]
MNAAHIIRIPILPFGMVNAHLIRGPQGCVLVDTGLPGSEGKIGKVLARQGLSFRDIRLIVITHAHVDHAGSAARLRELSGAPIVAHAGDLPHLRRELPMTFCATGWFGRLFLRTRLMYQPYVGFTPDLLLSGRTELNLASYGVRGMVRHSAGHTAGSISVELDSGDALVGDLIASGILLGGLARTGHAKRPPFEDDPATTAQALLSLADAGAQRYYMGHGGPLAAHEVRRHAHRLQALAGAGTAASTTAGPQS